MDEHQRLDGVTEQIIARAIKVHSALGPGLLESAYEACLAYELADAGLAVESQVSLPVTYREVELDCGYRLDLLVEHAVIVELKAVQSLDDVHLAQLLTDLKLLGRKVGLLIDFNVRVLRGGIRRVVNGY
ncbi:MAG TPA: GxxExxY protein [Ktedonobacterales bacterium]